MAFLGKLGNIFRKGDPAEEQLEKDVIINLSYLPKELSVNLTTLFSFMELPQDEFERFFAAIVRLEQRGNTLQFEHRREEENGREFLHVKLIPTLWEHLWSTAKSNCKPELLEQIERTRREMLDSQQQ